MIRDKTRLLKRKCQVVQQGTHVLAVVEHAELTPDAHPDQDRGPTGGLTAHDERPGLHQLPQAVFLAWGQLWSAPTAIVIDQAVHAPQQKGLTPLVETGDAEVPSFTEYLHGHLVRPQVE